MSMCSEKSLGHPIPRLQEDNTIKLSTAIHMAYLFPFFIFILNLTMVMEQDLYQKI